MTTSLEWGFRELDLRRAEDGRFPVEPVRGTAEWDEFARMKRARARRRKAMGFSRAHARSWVNEAARREGGA
ncbi:hypothetical protein GCM10011321_31700 [Youhaiella tibetensis]|uniref:Uncharacterized protein n=1 Tax=Paradevosia tibetensis TaxID=1447062 RepID=A0A5B9DHY3_9HYPH|nr:hypothetical protein [Youhaiella tibetensis]AKR57995.1 hypothetical protein XM25_19830 [Devosia sp. H5989]QEE18870.1 hypothetical protein FNA67_01165 [Youhaiella tibetensis]GGF38427.1 hypothetical protein GCM10011321_31700 [Youhaiella tibetensis]